VLVAPGNENERRHLLPLLDRILERERRPKELWADRGYHGNDLAEQLLLREIEPRISKPRRRGDPIPDNVPTRVVLRYKTKQIKTADPLARHRWPVERTIAWLRSFRRIETRRDRKADNYLAFLQLGMILILARAF
jgi:transposase